ncbi:peroxiredoxin [Fervidobacterium nodosum]|uniref:Alkyl hydroperoxide reductase/ Thiol specific antioxidant/ Mal allergen n=1 Tax=Fervidobacterium nodosum (strain ATCC 35602 / DSM 5306 / Rt17-B1) TaxID=381764 RepID=A7HMU6_FERNB|nr:peroxiredoxin [Fervidobacterium nodosum]ABS61229.1 alkyl hydroperoxide reductase/ Thiol specific antioxidant/ Mal allergen [Fervidobacterium nodosum Rt17-B1]PHJ13963.1 alkyl hydroperoxide reductase [Fervidobacterium sp. SC_NGM5_G05]
MLELGQKAPNFELVDHELKPVKLSELKGKVVLAFYPGAFTSVCEKELCTFRDMMAKFNNLNATVFGISIDTPFSNKAFAEKNKLNFRLLSDFGGNVAKQYGGVHENFINIPNYTVAKRAVFVLDDGVVIYKWVTDNPAVEPPYEEIQKVLG